MCNLMVHSLLTLTAALITGSFSQRTVEDVAVSSTPSPVYPTINFEVLNAGHVFLRQGTSDPPANSSQKTQTFVITDPGAGLFRPTINASYGPLTVDAPVPQDLLLSGRKILPFILGRQVRSSLPIVRVLFHMPSENNVTASTRKMSGDEGRRKDGAKAKDGAHCVTAYAFWDTKEVRGSCLVSPGGFCVAQLKPEPAWFSSAPRSGSTSKESGKSGVKGSEGNVVEVYFQSRRDQTAQCLPQDSLQRVGVGRGGGREGSGTPMRRVGSVTLFRTQPGNPTFFRLRLGGAVVIQTSSKPLKTTDVATFYVFLASTSTVENFTLRVMAKTGLSFSAVRPSDSALWDIAVDPTKATTPNTVSVVCQRKVTVTAKRGLLEILQLDFVPKDASEQVESQTILWRLELPGNIKDVGTIRIYTAQRDYVGLAPLVMNQDVLNTAVLTGKMVSIPVKTVAVEADGSITDVTKNVSCRSTDEDVLKVSEKCDYVFVNGKETSGKSGVLLNYTYGFLSAQLEMRVWMPRLPLRIEVSDPELNQIKGWRVPITSGNRRSTWDSDEEEEMRKGRGCMLQYQHTTIRVMTPFTAQTDSQAMADLLTREKSVSYFMGPEWQVDVTNLVRYFLKVGDPEIVRLQDGVVVHGRGVGSTTVQVLSPLTSLVLAERSIRVVDDKVSVTELGVQLVSGLSLSLQRSPGSNRAIVAMATAREVITQLKQEAVVSCWVQFSDGAVTPLDLFDRNVYSLTVSTPDESVAVVRRTPQSTFVVAQGEGQGHSAVVKVELRICEECQKSKRKSKLVVGSGLLKISFQNSKGSVVSREGFKDNAGGAAEALGEVKTTVTTREIFSDVGKWLLRRTVNSQSAMMEATTSRPFSSTTLRAQVAVATKMPKGNSLKPPSPTLSTVGQKIFRATPGSASQPVTSGGTNKDEEQRKGFGTMLDISETSTKKIMVTPKKDSPKFKTPRLIESDLIQTFKAMSDLEIGMYALLGVSCIAILGFLLNCASYKLCFRKHKTPIKYGQAPTGEQKTHKHDWVWLGHNNNVDPAPGVPNQVSTLKRKADRTPLEPRHSIDSAGQGSVNTPLPTVSLPIMPERTATLGRSRASASQQGKRKPIDPMANRSATLLARPHRNEPLHSPTSKRNQVQFTTFTTLDIKHLAALKRNGVDLNWSNEQAQNQLPPAEPQMPLPDMPWPVVKPLGEPQ
ncbi:transmembrane protein 132D-like isoform X1 [Synchiropus splendidus]|uniref:transmembrane protein 132D-like isoform X1 n=1 Tax=Synchiropus splendidus TaxID=270530 RepID=UPI00237E1668|nr:transmembrane protein 132D-like isoform X1 [Synchiropus splendidus]